MRTEHIVYLKEIEKTHSLNHASANLCISVQALSASIKKLEMELDTILINSSRNGTVLTPEGKYLLTIGNEFLQKLELINENSKKKKEFIYPCIAGISDLIIDLFLKKQELCNASMIFTPLIVNKNDALTKIKYNEIEFCLVPLIFFSNTIIDTIPNNFEFISFGRKECFFLFKNDESLIHKEYISLKDLENFSLIILERFVDANPALIETCKKIIPQVNIKLVEQESLYRKMLNDGNSIALVLENILIDRDDLSYLKCKPVNVNELYWEIGFLKLKNHDLSNNAQNFLRMLSFLLKS